jgi:threonine dehydrogenase-like Zn-dependent dehydrogenase
MTTQRRHFLLLVTLAAVAATPAWGQSAVPTTVGTQGAPSIPGMSGTWGHPFLTGGLEPPASGPGPVTNRSRRSGVSSVYQAVGDYTNPILQPHAAEAVKRHGEISQTGVTYPTPGNQCWPEGVPFIFGNCLGTLLRSSQFEGFDQDARILSEGLQDAPPLLLGCRDHRAVDDESVGPVVRAEAA